MVPLNHALAISYDVLFHAISKYLKGRVIELSEFLAFVVTYQQIAVLGIVAIILGRIPLRNPAQPYCRLMMAAALNRPRAVRISASSAVPLVWRTVFITSNGVVTAAATAPATPPAIQCVNGSYFLDGFMILDVDS